jgi:hypothetical protein
MLAALKYDLEATIDIRMIKILQIMDAKVEKHILDLMPKL